MKNSFGAILLVGSLSICAISRAQDFETLLLPLAIQTPYTTSYGASWYTRFYVRNIGLQSVRYLPNQCGAVPCGLRYFDPGVTTEPLISYWQPEEDYAPGRVMRIEAGSRPSLAMSLHLVDASCSSCSEVELPVVSEHAFLSGASSLLDISASTGTRLTVRVYDLRGNQTYTIRAFDEATAEQLYETTATTLPTASDQDGLVVPGFALVDVRTGTASRVRVDVTPASSTSYWSFASVLREATHSVSITIPQ